MKDAKRPDTTSYAYDSMLPAWQKIQAVLDGTEAMRSAGQAFLPQHHRETDDAYQERLARATLLNLTALTLNSWVGKPFRKPILFATTPPKLEEVLWDVDLVGTDIQVFCRNWFYSGLAKALSHVYVDFPRLDDQPRTLADDVGLRPYCIHWRPEDVFFVDRELVGGREVLREVRVFEDEVTRNGFAESVTRKIRRVWRDEAGVHVELYQLDGKVWVVTDQYDVSLPVIPMVTYYADRSGFMYGKPPLEDLADLNIAHWQSTSDQRSILTVARFPMLALSGGLDQENQLVVGPNRWLHSPDPSGRFYYVEHSGAAIGVGRQDLMDLEEQMAQYGADFLRKRPNATATARILDNEEVTSPLQDAAVRFGHALKQVLDLIAQWMGLEDGGVPKINLEFGTDEMGHGEYETLRETRRLRDISRKAYLNELQRRGLLDEEYDAELDAEQLNLEAGDFTGTTDELE